jgi:ribonuclease R/exosome complex exonuclease DIS3/RRP44
LEEQVTYSDQRFAYEEAQVVIENGVKDQPTTIPESISIRESAYEVSPTVVNAILKMDTLAKTLRKKRLRDGAITFDKGRS